MPAAPTSDEEEGPATDEEAALLKDTVLRNQAYESMCRARMWQLGVPAFATLACVACLFLCEDCLFGVMLFCVLLCFKDLVLVLVFVVSLALLLIRHPMDTHTVHRVVDAGLVLVRPE
jgi:hypothetical protein